MDITVLVYPLLKAVDLIAPKPRPPRVTRVLFHHRQRPALMRELDLRDKKDANVILALQADPAGGRCKEYFKIAGLTFRNHYRIREQANLWSGQPTGPTWTLRKVWSSTIDFTDPHTAVLRLSGCASVGKNCMVLAWFSYLKTQGVETIALTVE